ncbi:MAG: class I SAM-dependent methyltransferase [Propionibacteriales bacterium]|nr:class I SAM-dependent methyltransferase [Propionibacteriales bacterium]
MGHELADEHGVYFRADPDAVVEVLFDGRRIWSIAAKETTVDDHGVRHVEWPRALCRFLDGRVCVALRERDHEAPFAEAEVSFGSGTGRVAVVDFEGRPLAMTKWGRLNNTFDSADREVIERYLDQAEEVLKILQHECGVAAFISYGTLLGAVREGKLIGHDVDVDLGYLSDYEHPVDVQRESFRIERVLRGKGFRVLRQNGGFLALFIPEGDGLRRNLDVFTCFVQGKHIYQVGQIRAAGDRSTILPLRRIPFEGRMLPAPARPEVLFEAAYGDGWRVPDPSFKFDVPVSTSVRMEGWLGGLRADREQWAWFYNHRAEEVGLEPTPFAAWVAEREDPCHLVDLGCGNGRDSIFFATKGFDVLGLDFVRVAWRPAEDYLKEHALPVTFELRNLNSLRETLATGARIARWPSPRIVYGRFLVHSLRERGLDNMWRLLGMALRSGGRSYLEFRTARDRDRPKHFGRRFRRFLTIDEVVGKAQRHGLRVVEQKAGTGLAPFVEEDPFVCRLVLESGDE